MGQRPPIFTREEIKAFLGELQSKFRGGVRSPDAFLYIFVTLLGVGWATWAIPAVNNTQTSPETLGIYAIGFFVTLFLDAMFTWKRAPGKNVEQAIAVLCMCISFLLIVLASYLSVAKVVPSTPANAPVWRDNASGILGLSFVLSVLMSLVLSGFEAGDLPVAAIDKPVDALKDRNG